MTVLSPRWRIMFSQAAILASSLAVWGCVSTSSVIPNPKKHVSTWSIWWEDITGWGAYNLIGGLISAVGILSLAVGYFFPFPFLPSKKNCITIILIGAATILAGNWFSRNQWLADLLIYVGIAWIVVTHWATIKAPFIKIKELFSRKDEDADGQVGP